MTFAPDRSNEAITCSAIRRCGRAGREREDRDRYSLVIATAGICIRFGPDIIARIAPIACAFVIRRFTPTSVVKWFRWPIIATTAVPALLREARNNSKVIRFNIFIAFFRLSKNYLTS